MASGLVNRGLNAMGFGILWCKSADVFPERPGDEIIALHSHDPEASCAVRVVAVREITVWHGVGPFCHARALQIPRRSGTL